MDTRAAIDELVTNPERYVPVGGTYADGYIDALLDLSEKLGLARLPVNYQVLRREMVRRAMMEGPVPQE